MSLLTSNINPFWGIWKIEESSEELFGMLERGDEYLPELDCIRTEHRRQEWLASRTLLQEMLGRFSRIAYHPNGAPYLPDEKLHISISHTKGYVALLLQEQSAAGIDIEYRSDRVLKIRSRFMNLEEEAAIDKVHETEHLLVHWCAKEALFKMIGQTDVDFRKHLHVYPFEYAAEGKFTAFETRTDTGVSYKLGYRIHPDFVMVWSEPE